MDKTARYREIAATLARHGLQAAGGQFGKDSDEKDEIRGQHVREACEELGTTFIKLAQALSTRADLLPEAYRAELVKLQDNVPPVDAQGIERVIVDELGASPEIIFAAFDWNSLASASIGQVHAARLRDGREVVVKVQKPGVAELVDIDLEILCDLAGSWSERLPVLQEYDAKRLVQEFSDSLRRELDYGQEAANTRRFKEIFKDDRAYAVPAVIDEYSTQRVLVLTRATGAKPAEVAQQEPRRRSLFSRRMARFVLEPAFEHGVFHADPHAGNFLLQNDGALVVVDFGMVARLTPQRRRRVADIFVAIDRRDAQRLADRLIQISVPAQPIDRGEFTAQIERMLERYVDVEMQHVQFGEAIGAIMELIREHRLRLPGSVAQLLKALVMCEGLLQMMDPHASLADYLEPVVSKLVVQRLAGDDWTERLRDSAADAAELSLELPRRIDRVLSEVERGNLRVWTRVQDVDAFVLRFEKTVERANATMLASACIVALAIVMLFYHPQGFQQWIGIVFWVVFAAALVHVVRTLLALRK